MNLSKIDQLEQTLLDIEQKKKKENIYDELKNESLLPDQKKKYLKEIDLLKKTNQLFLNEIKKLKNKQKAQYNKINQSMINTLSYNREVMNDINKSFQDPDFKKKLMNETSKREDKAEFDTDAFQLKEENQRLKNEVINLQTQLIINKDQKKDHTDY